LTATGAEVGRMLSDHFKGEDHVTIVPGRRLK